MAHTRQNLDPGEEVIFIYDTAPAHRNPAIPAAYTTLEMLPPYSPFLNIVEQAISSLKAAIKGDVSRPEIQLKWMIERRPDAVRRDAKDIAAGCSSALQRGCNYAFW